MQLFSFWRIKKRRLHDRHLHVSDRGVRVDACGCFSIVPVPAFFQDFHWLISNIQHIKLYMFNVIGLKGLH